MIRHPSRAFTLVEILVSLAAGGLVMVGLMGLSKNATVAFNEEVRVGSLQASVRSAVLRLQSDLALTSYLSSPNLRSDPRIVHTRVAGSNANVGVLGGARRLQGLRIEAGGSNGAAPRNVENGYRNDVLEVSGNLSGSDPFVVLDVVIGGGNAGCDRVILNMDSPTIWRLRDSSAADPMTSLVARIQGLFVPATVAGGAAQHLVRLLDPTGRSQFLATCATATPVTQTGAPPAIAIDVTAGVGQRILTTADTGGVGGWPGRSVGGCTLNPVHVARYEVGSSAVLAPTLTGIEPSTAANPKYDLYRSYLDANGNAIAGAELVAEYVAGLRFGLTVDSAVVGAPGTASTLERIALTDGAGLGQWAGLIDGTLARPPSTAGSIGPHRIRSVGIEVTARVPMADRDRPEPAGAGLRRYCIPGACVPGALTFARTRTMNLEVGLPNHTGVFY